MGKILIEGGLHRRSHNIPLILLTTYPSLCGKCTIWRAGVEAASGASGVEAASGAGGVEAASGAGGVEAASGAGGVEAASRAGGVEAASGAGGVEAASGAGGVEGTSCGVETSIGLTGIPPDSWLEFKVWWIS